MAPPQAQTAQPRKRPENPVLPPPSSTVGPLAWVRDNLFSSWTNTILTLAGLWIIYEIVVGMVQWGILDAAFTGQDGSACSGPGACWPFITNKLGLFM